METETRERNTKKRPWARGVTSQGEGSEGDRLRRAVGDEIRGGRGATRVAAETGGESGANVGAGGISDVHLRDDLSLCAHAPPSACVQCSLERDGTSALLYTRERCHF